MGQDDSSVAALIPLGLSNTMTRQITPQMIRKFAALVGDEDRIHWDTAFCRDTPYGRPIAHGALLIGLISAASTALTKDVDIPIVSLGYDKLRLTGPIFAGDSVTIHSEVTAHDVIRQRIILEFNVTTEGRVVAVGSNILKLLPRTSR